MTAPIVLDGTEYWILIYLTISLFTVYLTTLSVAHLIEQRGSRDKTFNLYSRSARFESRSGHYSD
jgi:hypothetical protein